jgi:GNAT superfamily N-acetyltransferase
VAGMSGDGIDLVGLHVAATSGLVLDVVEQVTPDVRYAASAVPDRGWNFGFAPHARSLTPGEASAVCATARQHARDPASLQIEGAPRPPGWQPVEREVWMWTDTEELGTTAAANPAVPGLVTRVVDRPTAEMIEVFDEVYVATSGAGSVGYSGFDTGYRALYESGSATPPSTAVHVAIEAAGRCVAIATISVVGEGAGLYFVGTRSSFRRRGLGLLATTAACREARARGARGVLLQTIPDSPVEALYAQLGFRRRFVAEYLVPRAA